MTLEVIFFIFFSLLAIFSAVMMITRINPIISALFLILNFFSFAGFYLILNAQYIAALQIIVYAGAIMVLFVFVILLLNLGDEESLTEKINLRKISALAFGVVIFIQLAYVILFPGRSFLPTSQSADSVYAGKIENIGTALFTTYLIPFEITSMLLLSAIIGAIILAKRKIE
ncbi:MAG: NADH-quinone oxidoreductase subunit J [Ignavibacteria bacterium]|nr:NADH-quinone oxidoreductase subunit J [Ignavibacteria bacterium]